MPLKSGYSEKTLHENIALMIREGYPKNRAVAASLNAARKCYFKKFPGGTLPYYLRYTDGSRNRKKNPVPPSSKKQVDNAVKLYEDFTGHEGEIIGYIEKQEMPDVLAVIGEIDGIMYRTVRDGVEEKYIHQFKAKARPLFAVSHDGKNLFMLGGAYTFTDRGIVDET